MKRYAIGHCLGGAPLIEGGRRFAFEGARMTEDEIAAHARGTLTPAQIAAHPERATLDALRASPLYAPLCATFVATEGNLLELTEDDTALQQIATIRWALMAHGPLFEMGAPIAVAEVGFHKGFFALTLRHLTDAIVHVYACDLKPESARAAELLNAADLGMAVAFTPGDSWLVWGGVLERIGRSADIAWIDGGHEAETLAHDLSMAMEYGARLILVDDAAWLSGLAAVIQDCANVYGYTRVTPPTPQDRRGIAVLVRA